MSIILSRPGVYVPPDVLTNKDLESLVSTSDDWIISRTGITERRISLYKNVKEMGVLAAKDLLKRVDVDPSSIDEVIFATNKHHNGKEFPAHAGYVASEVGVKPSASLYDLTAGCTGLVYALRSAHNNVLSGDVDKVLVLGAEHLSDITDYSDRNTCVLFGDAGGAYLVERSDIKDRGFIKNVVGGSPDVGNSGWPHGALALDNKTGRKLKLNRSGSYSTFPEEQNYLIMDGREVFKFATSVMRHSIHGVLEDTGYSLEDVDVIIPHGANIRIINAAEKGLLSKGFNGKIFTNLQHYGNTSTASVPLAAEEAFRSGIIKDGSLVINVAFGAGFTYGANLYVATE